MIGRKEVVPTVDRELFADEELDATLELLRRRMRNGREKYRGSWTEADLQADMVEELLDAAAYAILMIFRVRRTLPRFLGPTSNDWLSRPDL